MNYLPLRVPAALLAGLLLLLFYGQNIEAEAAPSSIYYTAEAFEGSAIVRAFRNSHLLPNLRRPDWAEYAGRATPYPREVGWTGPLFRLDGDVTIVTESNLSASDRFTADELASALSERWNIRSNVGTSTAGQRTIRLTRTGSAEKIGEQGYRLEVTPESILIEAAGEPGLYYGTRTLLQLIGIGSDNRPEIPGVEIVDWPDIPERAVHYDTKHSQDKMSYVRNFIRDLADYKINMLVWEIGRASCRERV